MEKNRIKVVCSIISLLIFFLFLSPVMAYTIDGDTVYINDSNVYLSATPHTIYSSGWVYFNLTSKVYSGDIDAVWGFDTSITKPTKAEIYQPHWVNWTTNSSKIFFNVSSFVNTTEECDYGHDYNLHHKKGNYTEFGGYDNTTNETIWIETTAVVCYDSVEDLGNNDYRITWSTRHSRLENWKKLSKINSTEHNFSGMNKWYYLKSATVEANKTYMVRGYVKVPISIEPLGGKYFFCVKPSSESISEAISNGHLYCIDPWWNSSWQYRKEIYINNTAEEATLNNFPAFIKVDTQSLISAGKMQSSCQDIRFTQNTTSGEVEIPYEIEHGCNTTDTAIWIRVNLTGPGVTTYMYYGNPSAPAISNETKQSVWVEYDFVTHLSSDMYLNSKNYSESVSTGTTNFVSGVFGEAHKWAGTTSEAFSYSDPNDIYGGDRSYDNYTLEWWGNVYESPTRSNYWGDKKYLFGIGYGGSTNKLNTWRIDFYNQSTSNRYVTYRGSELTYGAWYHYVYQVNGNDGHCSNAYENATDNIGSYSKTTDAWYSYVSNPIKIGKSYDYERVIIDEFRIRHDKPLLSSAWINRSKHNADNYFVVGSEETIPYYLTVTFNYTSINFGILNHNTTDNPAPNQLNGIYNVTVDTNATYYKISAYGSDFTGPSALSISNLKLDTNTTASNLSVNDAVSLSTSSQVIDTNIPSTETANFHGFWLTVPAGQKAGFYNTTVNIIYETV